MTLETRVEAMTLALSVEPVLQSLGEEGVRALARRVVERPELMAAADLDGYGYTLS